MSAQTIPQLNTSAFIRSVISDMRKTDADPKMVLDMRFYSHEFSNRCHACAGGSAVIHGLGGERRSSLFTEDQRLVAKWCNVVRCGDWGMCDWYGSPVPKQVQKAWSEGMQDATHPDFWQAWEDFADAWEAYERGVSEDTQATF